MRRVYYPFLFIFSFLIFILAGSSLHSESEKAPQKVKISPVSFSKGGSVTDINVDEKGNVSALILENQNLFFCPAYENNKCAAFVRINENEVAVKDSHKSHQKHGHNNHVHTNENEGAVSGAGEATPKMAVAPDGKIFVTWFEMQNWPLSRVLFSYSNDGGQTFSSPEELSGDVDPPNVLPNVAADGKGNVAVVWLGGGSNPNGVTTHLYLATSSDGGENFNAPEKINPSGTDVCGCCLPSAQYDEDGNLFIAYRDATKNIRDIFVLKIKGENKYKTSVSNDNWVLNACPNSGPRLAVYNTETVVAWRSKNQPLMAFSSNAAESFSDKLALDFKVTMKSNPSIVKSKEGTVGVAWIQDNNDAWILASQEFSFPAYLITDNGIFEIKK